MTPTQKTPDQIRSLRDLHPEMRERDFARIHKISEAELVAAQVGNGVTRLDVEVATLLDALPSLGEVMALTRNESAVHEKIGPFEKVSHGTHASIVLGEQIDLRIFPKRWVFGFAVQKVTDDGNLRRSLQFFDAAGDAVHKVHLRPATDIDAYYALVEKFTAAEQVDWIETTPAQEKPQPQEPAPDVLDNLKDRWSKLTDTHQFVGMLKKLNLSRHQAMHMIDREYAWQLDGDAVQQLFAGAISAELPIMAFVGNDGCIQIHSGPIYATKSMGPWINIMDPTFHLHLRQDHIAELWAVRKPTSDGHVTSIEAYGADGELIIQFFGKRKEGFDERPEWRELVAGLMPLDQSSAA